MRRPHASKMERRQLHRPGAQRCVSLDGPVTRTGRLTRPQRCRPALRPRQPRVATRRSEPSPEVLSMQSCARLTPCFPCRSRRASGRPQTWSRSVVGPGVTLRVWLAGRTTAQRCTVAGEVKLCPRSAGPIRRTSPLTIPTALAKIKPGSRFMPPSGKRESGHGVAGLAIEIVGRCQRSRPGRTESKWLRPVADPSRRRVSVCASCPFERGVRDVADEEGAKGWTY